MKPRNFILLLLALGFAIEASAQTIRGRLMRATPYGPYPAAYVAVTVYAPHMGRSAPAYSSPEGFYFLYNVPPGQYVLEVWTSNIPVTANLFVAHNRPWVDVAPITIR